MGQSMSSRKHLRRPFTVSDPILPGGKSGLRFDISDLTVQAYKDAVAIVGDGTADKASTIRSKKKSLSDLVDTILKETFIPPIVVEWDEVIPSVTEHVMARYIERSTRMPSAYDEEELKRIDPSVAREFEPFGILWGVLEAGLEEAKEVMDDKIFQDPDLSDDDDDQALSCIDVELYTRADIIRLPSRQPMLKAPLLRFPSAERLNKRKSLERAYEGAVCSIAEGVAKVRMKSLQGVDKSHTSFLDHLATIGKISYSCRHGAMLDWKLVTPEWALLVTDIIWRTREGVIWVAELFSPGAADIIIFAAQELWEFLCITLADYLNRPQIATRPSRGEEGEASFESGVQEKDDGHHGHSRAFTGSCAPLSVSENQTFIPSQGDFNSIDSAASLHTGLASSTLSRCATPTAATDTIGFESIASKDSAEFTAIGTTATLNSKEEPKDLGESWTQL